MAVRAIHNSGRGVEEVGDGMPSVMAELFRAGMGNDKSRSYDFSSGTNPQLEGATARGHDCADYRAAAAGRRRPLRIEELD